MGTRNHRDWLQAFERFCREKALPLTAQRRLVFEATLARDDHPTTDQIHEAVVRRMSCISRTTVYRTLELLAREALITKASHPGKAVRYDPRVETHHHLVCLHCGEVIHIFDRHPDAPVPDTAAWGFEVTDLGVQLRGTCRRCREKEQRP